jgi:polar amino acid transport system substrate-binding protein
MLWICCGEGLAKDLRVAASNQLSEPYTVYAKGEMKGGVIKDIFDRLGPELGVHVHFQTLPRKRLEQGLENGVLHIIPLAHPEWFSREFKGLWTEPLFKIRDYLVVRADSKLNYQRPEDLKGLRIGTLLGYQYPFLEPDFKAGSLHRTDVQSINQNVDMLLNHRVDAYICHDIVFKYFQKTDPRAPLVKAMELGSPAREVFWTVSRKSPVSVEQLNHFLRKLRTSGQLDNILKKYRPPEP